jgi:hypothetical protein
MENLDSEILNWISVAKGDLPGHDFRGNQYTTASALGAAKELAEKTAVTSKVDSAAHDDLAKFHLEQANTLAGEADKFREDASNVFPDPSHRDYAEKTAKEYEAAALKHEQAAKDHQTASFSGQVSDPLRAFVSTKAAAEAEQGLDADYEENVGQVKGQL